MEIKNREGIVRELADMLHQFDKELNDYITDVYAYYDEEEKTVTLDTFINVGGNSWLNDNHITIYRDDNHIDEPIDVFDTIEDIAEVVGIKKNDLIKKIATEEELDEDEVDYYKVARYATENYEEKIQAAYEDKLDLDSGINYIERAEEIIDEYEKEYEYEKENDIPL